MKFRGMPVCSCFTIRREILEIYVEREETVLMNCTEKSNEPENKINQELNFYLCPVITQH